MPLTLYLPADLAENTRLVGCLQLWLAAQGERCRRAERFLLDRRHLLELDERLLADVGLTHEDVLRDVPFRCGGKDIQGPG